MIWRVALALAIFVAALAAREAIDARLELASAQTRAVACEATAEQADRVILTCLSWQVVVKMELESLERTFQQKGCL